MDFYHNLITEKSWQLLQTLRRKYHFILIGGWAVFLYTQALKSKDIDLVAEYQELKKLGEEFSIFKNDRLKKYEAKKENLEVDIYIPFYSNPGIPAQDLKNFTVSLSGFTVVEKEILVILKQEALMVRRETVKGRKDLLDLVSLFRLPDFDWVKFNQFVSQYKVADGVNLTKKVLKDTFKLEELNLNVHQLAQLKRKILPRLNH